MSSRRTAALLTAGALAATGASLALLTSGKFRPRPGDKVCALICGAGGDGLE